MGVEGNHGWIHRTSWAAIAAIGKHKRNSSVTIEWMIAREKRRDLLHQVATGVQVNIECRAVGAAVDPVILLVRGEAIALDQPFMQRMVTFPIPPRVIDGKAENKHALDFIRS